MTAYKRLALLMATYVVLAGARKHHISQVEYPMDPEEYQPKFQPITEVEIIPVQTEAPVDSTSLVGYLEEVLQYVESIVCSIAEYVSGFVLGPSNFVVRLTCPNVVRGVVSRFLHYK